MPVLICLSRRMFMAIFIDTILIVSWFTALGSSIWAGSNLDNIIILEYQNYREKWERNGKPYRWFSQTPGSAYNSWVERWVSAPLSSQRLSFVWLFTTPKWMGSSLKARKLLRRYRIRSFIAISILLIWWATGFWFSFMSK